MHVVRYSVSADLKYVLLTHDVQPVNLRTRYLLPINTSYSLTYLLAYLLSFFFNFVATGTVAEWLVCWTQAQKGPGSNRSHDVIW